MPDSSWQTVPAPSRQRSVSLSSLTSFSSSMSIFQPTPPLNPASPPMPIPDTFDLDFEQGAKPALPTTETAQTAPAAPVTPTTPPPLTACTMPVTPPPSNTRSSKRKGKTTPSAASSRPAKPKPPPPTRTTAPRGRRRSPAARRKHQQQHQSQQQHQDGTTMAALQVENRALRRAKWALENTNALLQAQLLTGAEQVRHVHTVEAQLDHAQRYVRALRKQVRSLGGFVMGLGSRGGSGEERDGEDADDGDNDGEDSDDGDSDGDDGELSAAPVPAYFPDAARHPHKYTMLAVQRERARGKKAKPKLKY